MDGASPQDQDPSALPPQDAAPASPPSPEQAAIGTPAPAVASKPKPTVNVAALQAGLTQLGQRNAAILGSLGLPPRSPQEDVDAAVAALRSEAAAAPEYEMTPEQERTQAQFDERAWTSAGRDFGSEFSDQARHIQEVVYGTTDPYELVKALHESAEILLNAKQGQTQAQPSGDQADPPEQAAPAQPSQERPGVDMEVGQPGWIVKPDDDDKPGSGDTAGFFRRALGGAARPQR